MYKESKRKSLGKRLIESAVGAESQCGEMRQKLARQTNESCFFFECSDKGQMNPRKRWKRKNKTRFSPLPAEIFHEHEDNVGFAWGKHVGRETKSEERNRNYSDSHYRLLTGANAGADMR